MGRSLLHLFLLLTFTYAAFCAVIGSIKPLEIQKFATPLKVGRSLSGDADTLYEAIQSNDTSTIINVLAKRTLAERLEISDYYDLFYDQSLLDDLKDVTSGDFENLLVAMLTPLTTYYAGEIYNAVTGLGTDEPSLTEILITLSNDQIAETSQIYYETYQETLEDAITDDTDGFFRDFLISLSQADRDEDSTTNESDAIDDAEALFASNNSRFDVFNDIFSHRSYAQLSLIFEEYEYWADETIETAIENNFSDDIKDGFLALVEKVQNEPEYFAQRFYESMGGLGTSDSVLIRLAVTRSEIDIEDIKTEYREQYSISLSNAIIDETSGEYQKCLLLLIGE